MNWIILDVETVGLNAEKHEVVEISIIRVSDLKQITRYIKLSNPENADQTALNIIGLTINEIQSRGKSKEAVVEELDAFIKEDGATPEARCAIGHCISFDRKRCDLLWKKVGKIFPVNCYLDTKTLTNQWAVKNGMQKPYSLTLENSLKIAGLKPISNDYHTARGDVRNTFLLWKKGVDAGLDYLKCIKRNPPEPIVKFSSDDDFED